MRKIKFLALMVFMLAGLRVGHAQQSYQDAFLSSTNYNTQFPCGNSAVGATAQIKQALQTSAFYGGGTVDLTCYQTPISITSDIFSPITKPITLILPTHIVTIAANVTIPVNYTLVYANGAGIAVAPGFVLTDNSLPTRSANGYQYLDPGISAAPTLTPGTGGTLALGTYTYCITSLPSTGGETQCSAEATVTLTGVQDSVSLTWPSDANAGTYRIYRGLSTGAENVYYTSATALFTDTGATGTVGTPPASNTAWITLTGGSGGGGSNVKVNGSATLSTANFNDTTPGASACSQNVLWQLSGANVLADMLLNLGNNCTTVDAKFQPGGTPAAQIAACLTAAGASGNICDASALPAPTVTSALVIPANTTLTLGNQRIVCSVAPCIQFSSESVLQGPAW